MPIRHQGFTLIEMLLVIVVIGIILVSSQSLFISNNNTYYAETCSNHIYASLKNHLYNATVGKKNSDSNNVQSYKIIADTDDNTITLTEDDSTTLMIDPTTVSAQRTCNDWYSMIITPSENTLTTTIQKNLSSNGSQAAFSLSGSDSGTIFTGHIILTQQTNTEPSTTKQIMKIMIDTRTQNITKHICLQREPHTGDCSTWQ